MLVRSGFASSFLLLFGWIIFHYAITCLEVYYMKFPILLISLIILVGLFVKQLIDSPQSANPVRIGIDELSHDHVHDLLNRYNERTDTRIIGIAESNKKGAQKSPMMFGDTSRTGVPFSKDPHVVNFEGRYLMYYSIPPMKGVENSGWNIGIAESRDLLSWEKVGEIVPDPGAEYEKKGLCAPGALIRNGKVHLFYQTYGNGRNDAICHAVSADGIHFERNATNPIFKPTGEWNCGRAIDAEVCEFNGQYFLYFATRDPDYRIQILGVAVASKETDFNREDWRQAVDKPILYPELAWEGECIEGASITIQNGKMYMFYAGAYNNWPQQVGVAVSDDGLTWERLSDEPFLPNGKPGEWNESESGHPHIFTDTDGRTYLFFQGNNSKGKNWYISQKEVFWHNGLPTF